MAGRGVVPRLGQQPGVPARPSWPGCGPRERRAAPARRDQQRAVAVHGRAAHNEADEADEAGGKGMSDTGEATVDDQLRWRGINHLAMVTPDMDATVRFYHGV